MIGLSVELKDQEKDEHQQPLGLNKDMSILICPSNKRAFISHKNIKKVIKNRNINLRTNLNKYDNNCSPAESPEKIQKSLNNYYLNIRKIQSVGKYFQNKKPFQNKGKNKSKNSFSTYGLIKFIEIPEIKEFNLYYEIPFIGKYDFLFLLRGGLNKNDWIEKTKNIRRYPRHLKNTLFFQSQTKLQDIHKQSFPKIYQIYTNIKNAGMSLYKSKKYRESLEYFNYAYGLFKWIEFKNKNLKLNSINNEIFSILDEDIEEKRVIIRNNEKEEEMYKACIIYILEIMAYCHMELRIYSSAIECLDECETTAGNNFPDIYLRRAQARICNRKISDDGLKLAERDINKAIDLLLIHNANNQKNPYDNKGNSYKNVFNQEIYYKVKNNFNQVIQKRFEFKINSIRKLISKKFYYKKDKINSDIENNILNNNNEIKFKILKEIKKKYNLAVKFFTEMKNKDQLDLTYKEYESFYEVYSQFRYFYKFSTNSIDKKVIEQLNDNEKKQIFDENCQKIIETNKIHICEYIFAHGNYNIELYKYAVDKIMEEEKNNKNCENKTKFNIVQCVINLSKGKYFVIKISLCFMIICLVSIGFQMYYLKNFRRVGITEIDK